MKSVDQTKKPTHTVYTVSGEGDNTIWNKVGVAWTHKDQKGLNQSISLLGLETKLVVRENNNKQERA